MAAPNRRSVIGAALALAACDRQMASAAAGAPARPLREAASFPVGAAVQAGMLADPAFAAFVARQVSQLTPEWEMKMEYIVRGDGGLRFEAPDAIAAFAASHQLRLFGHALVWHAQRPKAFVDLDQSRVDFRTAFANYITTVVGRYRGRTVGWDVVNEAVAEDGNGWRTSLWSERLGPLEHMRLAFELAHQADPQAVLFLNDYNLERLPAKRATFLKLAETLIAAGAPLGGLGSQTHVAIDLAPGAISTCLAELARLGLPVRISEMDVSIAEAPSFFAGDGVRRQSALYAEAAGAMASLPERQRFDLTFWGLRDQDSWLRRDHPGDTPAPFDDRGAPKPCVAAFEAAARRRA